MEGSDTATKTDRIHPWVRQGRRDKLLENGRRFSIKEIPVISFIGELEILLVDTQEEKYRILKEEQIPSDVTVEELYGRSCENLARDVEFVIANTMYGGFSILADGIHEGSALCFRHIWETCAEKLEDDLLVLFPAKDTLLFAPLSHTAAVEGIREHSRRAYFHSREKMTQQEMIFIRDRKELALYEA